MDAIRAWLIGNQDYLAGVNLFEKLGGSSFLVAMFRRGETEFNRTKLNEQLQVMLADHNDNPALAEAWDRKEYLNMPPAVQELTTRFRELYKDIGALHAQMRTIAMQGMQIDDLVKRKAFWKENKLADIVHTLLDLDDERDRLRLQINYFNENGKMPEVRPAFDQQLLEMPEGEIRRRLQRLRPLISKHRNKPTRKTEVDAWVQEVRELENRLDELI